MTDITRAFDNSIDARKAVSQLLNVGFKREDIHLIDSGNTRLPVLAAYNDNESAMVTRGAAAGALFGGVMGALAAGLTGSGIIVFPEAGVLFSGHIVSILAGTGAGAAVGGLCGALIGAGINKEKARRQEKEVRRTKTLVAVHTDDQTRKGPYGYIDDYYECYEGG